MNPLPFRTASADLGLLIMRVMVGVVGIFHGSQKLFGAFGGHGIRGFAGFLESIDVPMPMVSAVLAGSAEFFGGLLLAIGLLPRIAAIPFAFTMFVAAFHVHGHAFSAQQNGMEYPLTLGIVLVGLALVGPGRWTLQEAVRRARGRAGTPSPEAAPATAAAR